MNDNFVIKDSFVHDDVGIRVLNLLQSEQAIVVVGEKGFYASLYLYERGHEGWQLNTQMQATIGRRGMGKTREGDDQSPVGIFSLATAFGIAPEPEGCRYPYRLLTAEDYWVDDSQSIHYNKWVRYREGDGKDWQSAEWLQQETICYQHAVVINYNITRQPGKGSAIFLHIWNDENSPTHGCTAVSAENMIRILKWLDFNKKPVLLQGLSKDILSITQEEISSLIKLYDNFVWGEDIFSDR